MTQEKLIHYVILNGNAHIQDAWMTDKEVYERGFTDCPFYKIEETKREREQ